MLIGPSIFMAVGLIMMVAKTSLIDIDKQDGVFRIRSVYCLCFRSTEDIPLNEISRVNLRHVSNSSKSGAALYTLMVETIGRNVPLESGASNACVDSREEQAREINAFLARPSNPGDVQQAHVPLGRAHQPRRGQVEQVLEHAFGAPPRTPAPRQPELSSSSSPSTNDVELREKLLSNC